MVELNPGDSEELQRHLVWQFAVSKAGEFKSKGKRRKYLRSMARRLGIKWSEVVTGC